MEFGFAVIIFKAKSEGKFPNDIFLGIRGG